MSRRSLISAVLLFLAGLAGYAAGLAHQVAAQEAAPPPAAAGPALKTLEEKAAYAIGLSFGQRLATDNLGLSVDVIARGLADGIKKARPAMTEDEIEATMIAFSRKMQAAAAIKLAAQDPVAAKTLKEGQDFLAKNKLVKGVTTTESGLQYQVLASGKGPTPKKTDLVRVHYHGTLLSGKVFDSSVLRKEPEELHVGGVIPGWTEALQMMKVGDKWKLFLPQDLAYGPESRGEDITPFSVLVVEVELLEIV
jgi:FKBP-type peptidyl-prolyl cis-trans isomerase FklB